jgi:hypothetical protein
MIFLCRVPLSFILKICSGVINMRFIVLYIILTIQLITYSGYSAMQCSEFFSQSSNLIAVEKNAERLSNQVRKIKLRSKKGISYEQLKVPELRSQLTEMTKQLNLALNEHSFDLDNQIVKEIESTIKLIKYLQSKKELLGYKEYNELAIKYISIMYLVNIYRQLKNTPDKVEYLLSKISVSEIFQQLFNPSTQLRMISFVEKIYPKLIVVFTTDSLSIVDFNMLVGENIFYIGLSHKLLDIDLIKGIDPLAFASHDIEHINLYLKGNFAGMFLGNHLYYGPKHTLGFVEVKLTDQFDEQKYDAKSSQIRKINYVIFNNLNRIDDLQLKQSVHLQFGIILPMKAQSQLIGTICHAL